MARGDGKPAAEVDFAISGRRRRGSNASLARCASPWPCARLARSAADRGCTRYPGFCAARLLSRYFVPALSRGPSRNIRPAVIICVVATLPTPPQPTPELTTPMATWRQPSAPPSTLPTPLPRIATNAVAAAADQRYLRRH